MHIQRVIQKLGYTQGEAKVYLAALQLGACTISDLAGKTGMPRTSIQETIKTLHADGLMNPFTRQNHKFWVAENPQKLMVTLKEREASLTAVLPELNSLRYDTGVKPAVKTFNGAEEILMVMDDMLETKHPILAIVSWDDWVELFGKEVVEDFIEQRRSHGLRMRLLAPRSALSSDLKKRDGEEMRATRFLSDDSHVRTSNSFAR